MLLCFYYLDAALLMRNGKKIFKKKAKTETWK